MASTVLIAESEHDVATVDPLTLEHEDDLAPAAFGHRLARDDGHVGAPLGDHRYLDEHPRA